MTTTDQNKINLYKQFQTLDGEVQALKQDANGYALNRTKLLTQLQQNKVVAQEFGFCKDDAKVYKLIGPVMVAQTHGESKANVEKRIAFLEKEMKKMDQAVNDNIAKQNEKIKKLQAIQEWFQKQAVEEQQKKK